jgi:hypothetical protein
LGSRKPPRFGSLFSYNSSVITSTTEIERIFSGDNTEKFNPQISESDATMLAIFSVV